MIARQVDNLERKTYVLHLLWSLFQLLWGWQRLQEGGAKLTATHQAQIGDRMFLKDTKVLNLFPSD